MKTKPKLLTAEDLLELYSKGVRGELVQGIFCEHIPATGRHGEVAVLVTTALMNFIRPPKLGIVAGTYVGVVLERGPDTVREPDVAYFSAERLALDANVTGYYEVAPSLVVEIASEVGGKYESYDKVRMWLSFGVSMVWEVLPGRRSVVVHQLNLPTIILNEDDTLDGGEVLPGFSCPVREIFDL